MTSGGGDGIEIRTFAWRNHGCDGHGAILWFERIVIWKALMRGRCILCDAHLEVMVAFERGFIETWSCRSWGRYDLFDQFAPAGEFRRKLPSERECHEEDKGRKLDAA